MDDVILTNEFFDHKKIEVAGFKCHLKDFNQLMKDIKHIDSECTIQLMNADGIAGKEQVLHSTVHAIKSFSRKENISKDLGLEICVRTSGQRQISQALKMLGIKNGHINVCVVTVDCQDNIMEKLGEIIGERDDKVLEADDDKLKNIYNVTDIEIETAGSISRLLMEKTALLILET
jgi:KEOPS complex subunit Cgi121